MTIILLGIIIILAVLNLVQYQIKKNRNADLKYMSEKLNNMVEQSAANQLLLVTDDKELQALLMEINRLLTNNRKIIAQYRRMEQSMKKMLANIAHDLRTPLTVVLGYIETIQNDPDIATKERERILGQIHHKTQEIIKLMNTFFDLAKLESGDKEIHLTRINLNEICKNNILSFYDVVQAKGFEAVIHIPEVPIYALGNEEALDRILNNLLSNAIQHGGDGKMIGLAITYNDKHVLIEVWDQGKGISEKEKELVFERMFTLEDSRNKSFQGSGLGLTITKRLVEEMGGEIFLQSKPYQKTGFTIKLNRMIANNVRFS